MKRILTVTFILLCAALLMMTASAETIEKETFTLDYSEPWVYSEDDSYSQYASLHIYDGEEELLRANIGVYVENPRSYRSNIRSAGVDAYELVVNNAYELVNVAGYDCVTSQSGSYLYYYGRNEGANTSLSITFYGDIENETAVQAILDGLTITTEDIGNVDWPWPWNGERFAAGTYNVDTDNLHLVNTMLPTDEPLVIVNGSTSRVGVAGDSWYILCDKTLRRYTLQDGTLCLQQVYDLGGKNYEEMSTADGGRVFVSGFMCPLLMFDAEGNMTEIPCDSHYVFMFPDGEHGIYWFPGSDVTLLSIEDGAAVTGETIALPEDLKSVNRAMATRNHIYITGSTVENNHHAVFVLDHEGNFQFKLGDQQWPDEDALGWLYAMAETDQGLVGFDGNMKTVVFWDAQGSWLGTVKSEDMFGADYAWMTGCTAQGDKVLVAMQQERDDHSANELLVYSIEGYGNALTDGAAPAEAPEAESGDAEAADAEGVRLVIVNCKNSVNMREEPNTDCDILASVPRGTEVTGLGEIVDGFYKVQYDGKTGYISGDYVEEAK